MVAATGVALVVANAQPDSSLTGWVIPLAIGLQALVLLKTVGDLYAEGEERERLEQQRLLEG